MIKFGELYGQEKISKLRTILESIGPKGSFGWQVPGKSSVDLQITDNASVTIPMPFAFQYELTPELLILKFPEPYPIGRFKRMSKYVTGATVHGVSRIDIELARFFDGYVDVLKEK